MTDGRQGHIGDGAVEHGQGYAECNGQNRPDALRHGHAVPCVGLSGLILYLRPTGGRIMVTCEHDKFDACLTKVVFFGCGCKMRGKFAADVTWGVRGGFGRSP